MAHAVARPQWQVRRPIMWQFHLRTALVQLDAQGADGLIVQLTSDPDTPSSPHGPPMVNVSSVPYRPRLPSVIVDNRAVGQLAAQYLLGQGFRRLAFLQMANAAGYSRPRAAAFAEKVATAGGTCAVEKWWREQLAPHASAEIGEDVAGWLASVAKPLGVFAVNDTVACQVLDLCRANGIAVPEEVAVLGVDNDDLLCRTSRPLLSSIMTPATAIGYRAAALLEQLLDGDDVGADYIEMLAPLRVQVRQSTDTLALADRDIAECVRYIREHALEPLTVRAVNRAVPMARRAFEKRFRAAVGHTPLAEIHRVRLDKARQLLMETDLPVPEVAAISGFGDACRFAVLFRKKVGVPPSTFRRRFRATKA
ncbi:MAG TPA: substrate-binding domain-containing protein [Tepidisphaeraceae bacterium]|nr:substrate-binding domain-containing protein [Tepidisphaeraceae bacterium]